jgi:hypothetical protein
VPFYYCAVNTESRIIDGPWRANDEVEARTAFAHYEQRVIAAGQRALFFSSEGLDSLVRERPDVFVDEEGRSLVRGTAALTTVDRRARMFTPWGLAPSAPMPDDDVLVLVQQRLRTLTLPPNVPVVVRDHFRALCELAIYAAFAYDFNAFTIALSGLAHELVLGVKFVERHPDGVSLVRQATQERATLRLDLFGTLAQAMARDGRFSFRRGWRLDEHAAFRPTLRGLLQWAYDEGIFAEWFASSWVRVESSVRSVELTRQSNDSWLPTAYHAWSPEAQIDWWHTKGRERWERETLDDIAGLRNTLAHPTLHTISSPVDAIRCLEQMRGFIAVLWPDDGSMSGSPTNASTDTDDV